MEKLIEKFKKDYGEKDENGNATLFIMSEGRAKQLANITAEVAVGFAEWISNSNWEKKMFTHPKKVGQYYSYEFGYKTIQELFNLYLTTLK